MTRFTAGDAEMLRPTVSSPRLILPQSDAVFRNLLLAQLQKGLIIPNDLSSSSLSNCSNQDLNSELSQQRLNSKCYS